MLTKLHTDNEYFVRYEMGLLKIFLHFPYYKGNGKAAKKGH